MAKFVSSPEATLHPALERAWSEASACLARGGTFLLRTGPGYTNLLPIPAWRLRQFSAAELHALTGGAVPLDVDAGPEAANAPAADARKGGKDATAGRTPAALAARRARRARQKANKRSAQTTAHAATAQASADNDAQQQASDNSKPVSTSLRSDPPEAASQQHGVRGAAGRMEAEVTSTTTTLSSCSGSIRNKRGAASAENSPSGSGTQSSASSCSNRCTVCGYLPHTCVCPKLGAVVRHKSSKGVKSSSPSPPKAAGGVKRMRRAETASIFQRRSCAE